MRSKLAAAIYFLLALSAVAEPSPTRGERPAPKQQPAFDGQIGAPSPTGASDYRIEAVASGLKRPWSMAFLPEDKMLVSEREGAFRIVDADGHVSSPISGSPPVKNGALGGLLDIALDPDFSANHTMYFTFLEPRDTVFGLSVARARLDWRTPQPRISDVDVIFRAEPSIGEDTNAGGRILLAPDRTLYVSVGDRFRRDEAQSLSSHLGKIVRITLDGKAPSDNPFASTAGARPEIFSYGVRNPLGLALDAAGRVWEVENGPKGGDELNLLRSGANFGWPIITYGRDYDDKPIGSSTRHSEMEQPIYYWDPSIAVSGMTIYDGALFPDWKGNIFVSSLKGQHVARLSLHDGKIVEEERMLEDLKSRIRDIREGPDGALYILTDEDNGRLMRIAPNLLSSARQRTSR